MVVFLKVIVSIIMVIEIINPELSWKMSEGWKFKNAEPSDAYLVIRRIINVVILIVLWLIVPNQ